MTAKRVGGGLSTMKRDDPTYMKHYMSAQRERLRSAGGKRINMDLQPATVAALRELRARGAVSDAAAVNAAVVALADMYRQGFAFLGRVNSDAPKVAHEEATR